MMSIEDSSKITDDYDNENNFSISKSTLSFLSQDDRLKSNRYSLSSAPFQNQTERITFKFDALSNMDMYGYALGHFINDLTAAGWFNYLTIYLKNINPISSQNAGFFAGIVLLSGQISDGITTPFVGYLSDKTNSKLGKRIPWYIFGLILVCISYIFIFKSCLFCEWFDMDNQGMKIFYYILFPSLFNVGWASLQISHMSLVPSLSSSRIRRDKLNGLRNTFTYVANFVVLCMAFILFIVIDSSIRIFELLSYFIIGLGLIASLFFLRQINEVKLSKACENYTREIKNYLQNANTFQLREDEIRLLENENSDLIDKNIGEVHWTSWFKQMIFYQYGIVYMCVRLACNVTSSLFNFYLVYVLQITDADLTKEVPKELALIPLILYGSSALGSLFLNRFYIKIGRKRTYSLGAFFIILSSIAMILMDKSTNWLIYPVAIINGLGQSITLSTGIVLISEVIGLKGANGAFVFGAYSFCDKVSNGIVLFLILNSKYFENNDPNYIRWITTIIPASASILAWIFILMGKIKDYKGGPEQKLEDELAQ